MLKVDILTLICFLSGYPAILPTYLKVVSFSKDTALMLPTLYDNEVNKQICKVTLVV